MSFKSFLLKIDNYRGGRVTERDIHSERQSTITLKR